MTQAVQLSRRTILRGFGAAVALPMLEAMRPLAPLQAALPAVSPPRRIAFFFVPNGVNMEHWTPKKIGYNYDLPSILQPLRDVKDDVLVVSGLAHDKGRANGDGPGDHARSAGVFLTACQPRKTASGDIYVGPSVDQIAAQHAGKATRFPSLELGCENLRDSGNCDSGYSCAYSNNISWASPTTPMAKEIDPRLVFERLFGSQKPHENQANRDERLALRKSILDYVAADARRLHGRLGLADRQKLDEYLSAVRSIERRLDSAEGASTSRVSLRPPEGIPQEYTEHCRLMTDMMVLAFQSDLTRIATCMFAHAGSNRSYRHIGIPDGHHDLSHHGGDREKLDKIRRINCFHMEQFAYFLKRLKSIPEGDGTLLDQSIIVYGSGLGDGNRHNHDNLPVLVAGSGGGTIQTGRHLVYPQETPMANLFVSILERMDVPVSSMGDSTGPLPYLG